MPQASFSYPALPAMLADMRADMRAVLAQTGWHHQTETIQLAAGEHIQNIIRHGFGGGTTHGTITITLDSRASRMTLTITDTAPPCEPATWDRSPRPPEAGGLGLGLIDRLADEARFTATDTGNQAVLIFRQTGNRSAGWTGAQK